MSCKGFSQQKLQEKEWNMKVTQLAVNVSTQLIQTPGPYSINIRSLNIHFSVYGILIILLESNTSEGLFGHFDFANEKWNTFAVT